MNAKGIIQRYHAHRACVISSIRAQAASHVSPGPIFFSRNEFNTTETELNAIAAEAIMGLRPPNAATGMATVL